MRKWFLRYMRFDTAISLYCAQMSGNKMVACIAVNELAAIDRELDMIDIQERSMP